MLVYTRREPEHQKAEGTSPKPLTVPNAAAQLVEKHNAQFTEECQVYSSRLAVGSILFPLGVTHVWVVLNRSAVVSDSTKKTSRQCTILGMLRALL